MDRGVAELVEALSGWPGLVTVDSCQEDTDPASAYVMFVADGPSPSIFKLVRRLARELGRSLPDACYSVRLEWAAGGKPVGYLVVAPASATEVAEAIRRLPSVRRTW